ncbi:sensor histidine kinase [Actinomadura sp. WAC 06369]|uniref:sensor histidine kinase n=1 Tax=Actinomadura sp. WAC 06369 TaxID=2203193 RepID=UPI000F7AC9F5|nr:sensor histidine kinase [Actinomadura sp. WAC 06369]RSN55723.1 two-component sensor histidine kinase [Actinomadura sp. WAC 06369]
MVNRRVLSAASMWCAAALYPVVVYLTFESAPSGFQGLEVLLTVALTVAVLGMLARWPLPAFAVLLLAWTGGMLAEQQGVALLLHVLLADAGVAYVASVRPRWTSLTAAGVTALVQLLCVSLFMYVNETLYLSVLLALVVAWTAGNSVRVRRAHAEALRARETERALAEERLRIARELHDMVAHSVGIIAIQAGVGGRVIDTQPAEARKALDVIEATSRDTLASLRRMLTGLRREGALGPAPGLDDLERLAAATCDAGVRVDVRRTGERRELPSDVDLCAYRVVQEALTNVVRHAGVADCRVTIGYREDGLEIEVEDEGSGGTVGAGFGIVGMRERVALLRGEFAAGPRPGGGFRVAARIPA